MNYIGIVGARNFKNKKSVQDLVKSVPGNSIIVTGSCKGVCSWTIEQAKKRKLHMIVYEPDLKNIHSRFEVAKRYYQRNRELIERCDFVYAFISAENGFTGGTRFEIEYAIKLGKPFRIYTEKNSSAIVYQSDLFSIDSSDYAQEWIDFFLETFSLKRG